MRCSSLINFLKTLVSIFFLSIYLLANTELCQLAKVPVLLSHYDEHRQGGNLSFFTFLKKHYFNGDPHDADYETDMQLPFKTTSGTLLFHNPLSVPAPCITVVLAVPVKEVLSLFTPHYQAWVPAVCYTDIFQPPRGA